MSGRTVVAVDGGNSKTDVAILDETGRVLGTHRGPGASFTPDDHDQSVADLERSVLAAAAEAGIEARPIADAGVFCLAGADLPADDRRILRALRDLGLVADPVLRNDTFAVMRTGAPRGWGVAVVCGAGFNCTGVGPDGREVRFPALGAISGDWAGGATIGIEAVGACVRAGDGRGPRTALEQAVPAHFGLRTPRQVMVGLHTGKLDDSRVTSWRRSCWTRPTRETPSPSASSSGRPRRCRCSCAPRCGGCGYCGRRPTSCSAAASPAPAARSSCVA